MKERTHGIWIGENAVCALTDKLAISFLRLRDDNIISVFRHADKGTLGVVYGFGVNHDADAVMCVALSGGQAQNSPDAADYTKNHSADTIEPAGDRLVYKAYNGRSFEMVLAEKIEMAELTRRNPPDPSLTIARRMEEWNMGTMFEQTDKYLIASIDTRRYSIFFNPSPPENWTYCRVGQNGYCDKGRAMLSTVCIRQNETRMLKRNLDSLREYVPNENWFLRDSCAFPADYGWYWSVKDVSADEITLNGCGGDTYRIKRKK